LSGAASSATNATFATTATNATFASSATNASAATNATFASNSSTVGGFTPSQTNGTVNRVVVADVNGYITNNYFFSTDNVATGMTYVMGKFGDNYLRSASAATVATFISGQSMNISGSATNATFASSATNASAATNATFATSASSATNATFASSATNATYATTAGNGVTATSGSPPYYGARAWVKFNGTAATRTNWVNVSSITRSTTGTYVVNFSTSMPSADYSTVLGAGNNGNNFGISQGTAATGSVTVFTRNTNTASLVDSTEVNVAVFC
jgi:hypothetical protein